jgi:hypothetical protein
VTIVEVDLECSSAIVRRKSTQHEEVGAPHLIHPTGEIMELVLAYIDPGAGSLVIQALITGIVAVPIFFRRQIMRLVNTFRGQDDPGEVEMAPTSDDRSKIG